MNKRTRILMRISFLVGVLAGLGLAKLIVDAAAMLVVAGVIAAAAVGAALWLRRRGDEWREEWHQRHG